MLMDERGRTAVLCVESGDRGYPLEDSEACMLATARQMREDASSVGVRARTFRFFVDGRMARETTGAFPESLGGLLVA